MPTTDRPEWMTPGSTVIVDHGRADGAMRRATIDKVTATQIVLDNGDRFSRRDLRKIGRSVWDQTKLLNPTDPRTELRWLEHQQAVLRRSIGYDVDKALRAFGDDGDLTHAEEALTMLTAALDRYRRRAQKIAATRAAIKG